MREPLGITFTVPDGQEATGVYDDPDGIEVFVTDVPYLTGGGASLQAPLPVKIVEGSVFADSLGNVQTALAVSGLPDPEED